MSAAAVSVPPPSTLGGNLEPGIADILLRSRHTILRILEDRGYDATAYKNIAPEQILTLSEGHSRALDIIVPKRADSIAPCDRAVVIYELQDRIRQKLGTWIPNLFEMPPDGSGASDVSEKDDILVILNEPFHLDNFDKASLQWWQKNSVRISFFHIKQIVVHPADHVLVPPHRKLSPEEAKAEIARLHITQKSQLPLIKHYDMQARVMGLVPGDIVEILRPSPTAGVARVLRICAA
jgi:DNA-directed RNA polymerase subunit H (RpoH/RPB5)